MTTKTETIFSVVIFGENFNSSLTTIYSVQNYLEAGTYKIFLTFPEENLESNINVDKNSIVFADGKDLNYTLNKIFETSQSEYILFLSAGVVLSDKTLQRLSEVFDSDKKIGAVGPLLNYCRYRNVDYNSNFQLISTNNLKNLGELEQFAEVIANKKIQNRSTLVLDGACILVKREITKIVGVPDMTLGIFWDADYCLRILKAGFIACICSMAYAHCLNAPYPNGGGYI